MLIVYGIPKKSHDFFWVYRKIYEIPLQSMHTARNAEHPTLSGSAPRGW